MPPLEYKLRAKLGRLRNTAISYKKFFCPARSSFALEGEQRRFNLELDLSLG
jgi:hypothetical protein